MKKPIRVMISALVVSMVISGCAKRNEVVEVPETPSESIETPVEVVETKVEEVVETPVEEVKEPEIKMETVYEELEIPFKSIKENDSTLDKGKTAVKKSGLAGLERVTYEVEMTDGVETGRKEVGREVVKEPVNEVISVGTKEKVVVKEEPKPAPVENKPVPKPEPVETPEPTPEPVVTPEPTPEPEVKYDNPAYGTVSFSIPSGNYKVNHWYFQDYFYHSYRLSGNGEHRWGYGYGNGPMPASKLNEWLKYAEPKFPPPNRAEAFPGEEVRKTIWVWLP